ncbi:MAG: hypothetical protein QGI32_26115, partial [Candidatus Latescibacteria bacterium]|nr:hypothetical protein [Candidatus Latescibacterota bacterium]
MELLIQVDVAETMVYERIDERGVLELGHVLSSDGRKAGELRAHLEEEEFVGRTLSEAGESLAGKA